MQNNQRNIIEYIVCVIGAFAMHFSINNAQAYSYIRQYKGLSFLIKHYEAEHTLSIDDAVEDIAIICQRNGGKLAL